MYLYKAMQSYKYLINQVIVPAKSIPEFYFKDLK